MKTINWEHSSWKYLSLVGDEQVISLLHTKVNVFSDSLLCLGKVNENPKSNIAWEDRMKRFKSSPEYRAFWTELMVNQWNSSGISSQDSPHWSSAPNSKRLLSKLGVTPEKFTGLIFFMSMFNDISWGSKDNNKECESSAQFVSLCAKKFEAGQWSFLGPGSEKKWCSISEDSPQGEWDRIAEQMLLTSAESGHPVFRATSPLSRGVLKKQRWWKIVDTLFSRPGND